MNRFSPVVEVLVIIVLALLVVILLGDIVD